MRYKYLRVNLGIIGSAVLIAPDGLHEARMFDPERFSESQTGQFVFNSI